MRLPRGVSIIRTMREVCLNSGVHFFQAMNHILDVINFEVLFSIMD